MLPARENPFAVHRLEQLAYRLTEGEWSALLQRLRALGFRAALIGTKGSGKTTLLNELLQRLRGEGFNTARLTLRADRKRCDQPALFPFLCSRRRDEIVAIDGAEQLPAVLWWMVRRTSLWYRGLIITTHDAGRLPTLYRCRTSAGLLHELINELAPHTGFSRDFSAALFTRHGGDLRAALLECYETVCARGDALCGAAIPG